MGINMLRRCVYIELTCCENNKNRKDTEDQNGELNSNFEIF